jgi:hypothetical protein
MCIVVTGETQPDSTKLINIPVIMDNNKYNFFMYINNFNIGKEINKFNYKGFESLFSKNNNNSYGQFASFNSYDNFKSTEDDYKDNAIMVVPFPVKPNTPINNIGLEAFKLKALNMKKFIFSVSILVAVVFGLGIKTGIRAQDNKIKLLFLGDNGHHKPNDRFRQIQPVLAAKGIDLVYTDKVESLTPKILNSYQGLVIFANLTTLSPEQEKAMLKRID